MNPPHDPGNNGLGSEGQFVKRVGSARTRQAFRNRICARQMELQVKTDERPEMATNQLKAACYLSDAPA